MKKKEEETGQAASPQPHPLHLRKRSSGLPGRRLRNLLEEELRVAAAVSLWRRLCPFPDPVEVPAWYDYEAVKAFRVEDKGGPYFPTSGQDQHQAPQHGYKSKR